MATPDQIAQVTELLPDAAASEGWDDDKIGTLIDAGNSNNQILMRYWESRAASTAHLISISEDGSSRDLSVIHSNAVAQVNYWANKVKFDDEVTDRETRRGRAVSHTAVRA
jgi:hypothetical protein